MHLSSRMYMRQVTSELKSSKAEFVTDRRKKRDCIFGPLCSAAGASCSTGLPGICNIYCICTGDLSQKGPSRVTHV